MALYGSKAVAAGVSAAMSAALEVKRLTDCVMRDVRLCHHIRVKMYCGVMA